MSCRYRLRRRWSVINRRDDAFHALNTKEQMWAAEGVRKEEGGAGVLCVRFSLCSVRTHRSPGGGGGSWGIVREITVLVFAILVLNDQYFL